MAADAVAGETGSTEFGILGPLEVRRSGRAVPLGGPRQRAVLALLLLEANRVVSMDRLAEDVWGGDPPAGWATTLQTYVFHLRRALEPDRLRGVAGGILVTRDRGYLLRVDRKHLYLNPQSYPDLAARYPTRVHAGLMLSTTYLFLNTRQPPFTNIKARQAVNYAIDRARMFRLLRHGPGQAAVTCQILPPDFPSYQRYCPYTAGTEDGVWHGPDLGKARRLAAESGTTNVPVTVWTIEGIADKTVGSYLVQMLGELGYRASLRMAPLDRFVNSAVDSRNKIQVGLFGWGADFPAAGTFFLPLLSCRSFNEEPTNTLNLAEYCDHHVDALAAKAQAAQLTDPATARSLWAQVDRLVTDQAPWVPVLNEALAGFVSARVGNYQQSPGYTYLVDQMWVR